LRGLFFAATEATEVKQMDAAYLRADDTKEYGIALERREHRDEPPH
jgi:hypothetical protein